MIISVLPLGAISVSAATNLAGASPTLCYSSIDDWNSGKYSTVEKGDDGVYTISVPANPDTKKSQAFRVNYLKLVPNSTYYVSAMVKDGNTDNSNTISIKSFHNGHACLQDTVIATEGIGDVSGEWKKVSALVSFGMGSWTANNHYCATQSHRQYKQGDIGWTGTIGTDVWADTTTSKYLWKDEALTIPYLKNAIKGTEDGATYNAVIHAGFYFDSAGEDILLVKDFGMYKVDPFTATASMTGTEDVGSTTDITYTFSKVPTAAPAASNVTISGGAGRVSGVTRVSDTVYTVSLSGLEKESAYTVTLSGLTDSEYGMPLTDCSVSFTTEGAEVLPEGVFVDENFDDETTGSASGFFGGGVIELKSGSTTDKVVALSTTTTDTSQINFTLPEAITADDGVVEFSFDYFRKNNTAKLMRFYIQKGNVISGQLRATNMSTIPDQGVLGAPTQSGWNNISVRVNLATQVYTMAVNGKVTCDLSGMAKEFTFRNATTSITGGFLNMDADDATQTIFIDNFKIAKIDGDVDTLVNMNFEGASTGFTGGGTGFLSLETKYNDSNASNGVESGKALQINQSVLTASTNTTYSLSPAVDTGIVDVTFDVYKSTNSPRIQFYFTSSSGKNVVSSPINTNGNITAHTVSGLSAPVPFDEWATVTYRINVYKKTFSVIVNGTEYASDSYCFRDTAAENVAKLAIYCDAPTSAQTGLIQIDNLRFTTDVTNHHIAITSGAVINETDKTLSSCPIGSTVGSFKDSLTTSPAGTTVEVYSSTGALKEDTDVLEKYDVVGAAYAEVGRVVKYTVIPDYSIDFIGLTVNGNEYYEASKILEPGEATVRARIANNTVADKTFTVYASVVGDKLYDVELKNDITVSGESKSDVIKFKVDLPDNSDAANLKLILVDSADAITPLCEAEKKLAYTSQITRMPNVFSDHMVLQRNEPVNIFGWAPTGTDVTVTFGTNTVTGKAANGKFCVQLPAMAADSTGRDLVVTAGDTIFTYTDVVVGEVLYGSGQSNMQRTVSYADGAIALGQIPNVRYFTAQNIYTTTGRVEDTVSEAWKVIDGSNWKNVSGTMHCTAYYLREFGAIPEDVVIGIVNVSWGGTSIAMWLPADILEAGPNSAYYSSYVNRTPDSKGIRNSDLYSAMAKSIVPYTAKAAVWYQGEQDANVTTYNWYMDEMIKLMRAEFGKDIPYYAVQLPGYTTTVWSEFRLTQWKSHNPENGVHIVVTNDTGDNADIHPHDKDVMGERIARHVAYHTYEVEVPYQGPVFKDATVSGNQVTISFNFVNDGLHGELCSLADDNSLTKFEVSADGTTWYDATATISGDTIIVSSSSVTSPAYVRYGYVPTIVKSAGTNSNGVKLPMAPFSEQI